MANETMIDLILDNDALEIEEFVDLFKELFDDQRNRRLYDDIDLSKSYKDAIECLFDTELTVEDRINDAISICRHCFEAFYFFKMLSDERDFFNYADLMLYTTKGNKFTEGFNEYEIISSSLILDDIASFYMFRDNYKKAIACIYAEAEIDSNTINLNKIKLFVCYERIEDYDSFKKLYDNGFVDELVSYLLYLCVLVKALRTDDIVEVLMDMFHDFPESYEVIKARFLDETYEMDEETALSFDFVKSSLESIPNIYDILIDVIRKNNISPIILEN